MKDKKTIIANIVEMWAEGLIDDDVVDTEACGNLADEILTALEPDSGNVQPGEVTLIRLQDVDSVTQIKSIHCTVCKATAVEPDILQEDIELAKVQNRCPNCGAMADNLKIERRKPVNAADVLASCRKVPMPQDVIFFRATDPDDVEEFQLLEIDSQTLEIDDIESPEQVDTIFCSDCESRYWLHSDTDVSDLKVWRQCRECGAGEDSLTITMHPDWTPDE